ncbi:MAG: DUF4129 domain-containing protein [Anaerolineae bacterium]|nr:DUF4129 domain-containing protein [Anaerolineae bacterium]
MTDRTRRWAVLLSALAIVAVVLLAASLANLELLPGSTAPRIRETPDFEGGAPPFLRDQLISAIFVVLGILTVLFVAFFIFYLIFVADTKKRLLITLGLLIWFLILYLVSHATSRPLEQAQATPGTPPAATPAPVPPLSSEADMAGIELDVHPPAWLVWLGAVALALIAVGLLAGIAWIFWSRARDAAGPLEELAREAERALAALEAGADVHDTIVRCYLQMNHVLQKQRGISRPEAMTPREFERGLRTAGLPPEPVASLTRLFEKVRYGARTPDEGEERQAITSLEAIIKACRGAP